MQYNYDTQQHDETLGNDEIIWKGKVWKDLELADVDNVYHPSFGFGRVHKQRGTSVELYSKGFDSDDDGSQSYFPIDEIKTVKYGHLCEAVKHLKRYLELDKSTGQMAIDVVELLMKSEPENGGFSVTRGEKVD
jgi:hypothetical protein